ncbi:MAG TPA: multicopper oxidase [Haliangiales bacterium]|nr:multicopper oxidase [Haliangiales bacterium]
MKTRRQFIKTVGAVSAGMVLPWKLSTRSALASVQVPQVPLPGKAIPRFVEPAPTFVGSRVDGTRRLTVSMEEFQQQILPASLYTGVPAPYRAGTYVWGYAVSDGASLYGPLYPAFTIEARRGTATKVKYVNNLVNPVLQKYITVDQTLHWADPLGEMGSEEPFTGPVPLVVHLHGAEVPSAFDGGPESWFTPRYKITGPGYVSNRYVYPNRQEATTLFYHDHALGATRLNVYAGLAGFYFLRDDRDTGLPSNPIGLPAGDYEIELALQDRMFDSNGQLFFPDEGINPEHPYWVPEFFGDVIVVNGKSWPYLNVEPRRYRFRLVNGSNARFYEMRLANRVTNMSGPAFWQIGGDGGLLDVPAKLNDPANAAAPRLLMAPGERVDMIIDFAGYTGQTLRLINSAKGPFPKGTTPDPQTVGQMMEFRVVLPLKSADASYNPATGAALRSPVVRLAGAGALAKGVKANVKRQLTLNEVQGAGGPLEVVVNNTKWDGSLSPNAGGITELPQVGSTEVWEIINLTEDAHPIHLHLVQFQLVNRQLFNTSTYFATYSAAFPGGAFKPAYGPARSYGTPNAAGALGGNPDVTPFLQGPPAPPNPNETGWKDTFVMYPGQVTRIVVRFAPQEVAVGGVSPGQNLYPFDPRAGIGTTDGFGFPGGPGYVWHCHIIDHEDNEMMRPYQVV